MNQFALRYPAKADVKDALVQDFNSFRQALNVASADQRVLVLVNAPAEKEAQLRESFKAVANDHDIVGRFHFDFDGSADWKKAISETNDQPGIVVINPGEFGLKGKVMQQLPLDAKPAEIIAALKAANETYASTTKKKVYSEHVAKGSRAGVYFEGAVPYGEDRDGDGKIDQRGGGRGGDRSGERRPRR